MYEDVCYKIKNILHYIFLGGNSTLAKLLVKPKDE